MECINIDNDDELTANSSMLCKLRKWPIMDWVNWNYGAQKKKTFRKWHSQSEKLNEELLAVL